VFQTSGTILTLGTVYSVMPAKAGTQGSLEPTALDSRFCGGDEREDGNHLFGSYH